MPHSLGNLSVGRELMGENRLASKPEGDDALLVFQAAGALCPPGERDDDRHAWFLRNSMLSLKISRIWHVAYFQNNPKLLTENLLVFEPGIRQWTSLVLSSMVNK